MISRLIRLFVSVLFVTLLSPSAFAAGERQVTDLAGRTVTLPEGVERIVLGEGRLLSAIAILDHDDPLRRVAGMLDDYRLLDPDGYARWRQAFPGQDDVPVLGQVSASSFSVEKAIAVKPDLAIFTVGGHGPGTDASTVIAQLEAAGIPVIFVDFFLDPLTNTPASMALLGEVLGRPKRAQAFNAAFAAARSRVTDALAGVTERPSVFMEIRVGLGQDCCASVGQGALASLIEVAGGRNIAAPLIPGTGGMVSIEHLLTNQPDVYVGTAIGSRSEDGISQGRIVLGPGVPADMAASSFAATLDRVGIRNLDAVRAGRAHAPVAPFLPWSVQCRGAAGSGQMVPSGAVRRSRPGSNAGQLDDSLPTG